MVDGKYDRSVELHCPTCGGSQFECVEHDEAALVTCVSCGLSLSRSDLIAANGENIGAHVERVKNEVAADLRRHIQQAFKGNKFFRMK